MNFQELYRKIEAIDKGQSLDEFLGFGKKKEEPPKGQQPTDPKGQQPTDPKQQGTGAQASGQPAQDQKPPPKGGMVGGAVDAIQRRKDALNNLEETDKGDMDHDGKDEDDSEEWKQNRDTAIKKATSKVKEEITDECGEMGPMPPPQKQMDNVNMNVSLNASGGGGIRDLLDILRNIESKGDDMEMPVAIKSMGMELDDDFANEPDETYASIDTMIPTGSDLHSKGGEAPKVNGGGNPYQIMPRLESLYQEIKLREGSGPKEKQHSKYVDRNSASSKAKALAAKDKMAKDKAAEPGKSLLKKINSK